MSLIPFILDLAEELHDFNFSRSGSSSLGLALGGMDIDDVGFGMYSLEQLAAATHSQSQSASASASPLQSPQQPASTTTPTRRSTSRLVHAHSPPASVLWVPIKGGHQGSQHRHHPYSRVAGAKTVCCNKSLLELEKEMGDKVNSSLSAAASGAAAAAAANSGVNKSASAYSVVNRNGFQVSMNVKQFAPNELTVKTIDNCIVVEGQHDEKEDGHGVISRHFIRKYMLPKGFDPADVHSTLSSDGILTVRAPPPPPPAVKAGEERPVERIVDIQQQPPQQSQSSQVPLPLPVQSQPQSKDAQMPTPKSAKAVEQPTPKTAAVVVVAKSEQKSAEERKSNGNGEAAVDGDADVDANVSAAETAEETANAKTKEKETETETEPVVQTSNSTNTTTTTSNSTSTSTSNANANSSANNGEQKKLLPESKPVEVMDTVENVSVAAEKEDSTNAAVSSSGDTPTAEAAETKTPDANANGNVSNSNSNSSTSSSSSSNSTTKTIAEKKPVVEEQDDMPAAKKAKTETVEPPAVLEQPEKVEKSTKGAEEIAAVDAAILLAKNQATENGGATAAKSEEPSLAAAK